jgi:hypothetical protein
MGSRHAGPLSARWLLPEGCGQHRVVWEERSGEEHHGNGLVISEAEWLSPAHPDGAVVMPGAGTLER